MMILSSFCPSQCLALTSLITPIFVPIQSHSWLQSCPPLPLQHTPWTSQPPQNLMKNFVVCPSIPPITLTYSQLSLPTSTTSIPQLHAAYWQHNHQYTLVIHQLSHPWYKAHHLDCYIALLHQQSLLWCNWYWCCCAQAILDNSPYFLGHSISLLYPPHLPSIGHVHCLVNASIILSTSLSPLSWGTNLPYYL